MRQEALVRVRGGGREQSRSLLRSSTMRNCICGTVSLDAVVTGFENVFLTNQVDHSHAYEGALVAFGNDNQREDHANLRQVLMEFSQSASSRIIQLCDRPSVD